MSDIPSIGKRYCDSCGTPLLEGELFYHCRTEIVAGKDELLPDLDHPDKIIAQAILELEGREEQDLLDDIYQEIILQLCPECRIRLLHQINAMFSGCKACSKCQGPPVKKKKGTVLPFAGKKAEEKE